MRHENQSKSARSSAHATGARLAGAFLLAKTLRRSPNCVQPSRSARRKETLWKIGSAGRLGWSWEFPIALAIWLIVRASQAKGRIEELACRLSELEAEVIRLKRDSTAVKPAEPVAVSKPMSAPVAATIRSRSATSSAVAQTGSRT